MEDKVQIELLEDIYSFGKDRALYGLRGDKVNVVAKFVNVLIVENKQKNKFPVRIDRTDYKK